MIGRRVLIVLVLTGVAGLFAPAVVLAQEPKPPEAPPTANCGFLSAIVCQVPVSILVPVNIDSIFPPTPTDT